MLVVENFLGFERPKGREPGHPELLVRTPMVEQFGMPDIDYDNLARLYRDQLGYEAHMMPVTALFHRLNNINHPVRPARLFEGMSTHSFRWDNTVYINGDKRSDPFAPVEEIDSAHLMSQLILQATAHSPMIATKLHEPITIKTLLRPTSLGLATGAVAGLLTDSEAPGLFAGTAMGLASALSINDKRKGRIFDATKLVMPTLLDGRNAVSEQDESDEQDDEQTKDPGHRYDIVFPNRPPS